MDDRRRFHTLCDVFDGMAQYGERTALRSPGRPDEAQWSYARLNEHARRLAGGLIQAGVTPGDCVALLASTRPEWFVACLATIMTGATAAPLDEQLSDDVLNHVLSDSASRFVFTTAEGSRRLERLDIGTKAILLDTGDNAEQSWRRMLTDNAELPTVSPDDVAALFYTSGTTGPPKGVPLTHANLSFQVNIVAAARLVSEHDRLLLPLPLHHVYPFAIGLLLPFSMGLTVVLPQSLTGPRIVESIRGEKVTAVVGVPRLYDALYAGIESQARGKGRLAGAAFSAGSALCAWLRRHFGLRAGRVLLRPLHRQFGPSLHILACGGSQLDPELGFKLEGLGWRLAIGYGLTETSPLLTIDPPGEVRMGSAGLAMPGVDLRIDTSAYPAETEHAQQAEQGEILARGPNVFGGYRNLPEQTAEAFTQDGFFRTGDLGYLDRDGYLFVTGRVSTLIVTQGGENVQPDEIETAYLREPIIREIGVLQEDERLVAVIVPDTDQTDQQSPEAIEAAVRTAVDRGAKQLASYKRIARYAITREALPRTRLGKLQRHLLKKRYKQALQEGQDAGATRPLAPEEMSDQDRALLENSSARQVWEWLSERYPDLRLTPESSMQFDLGVDSLSWLNLTLEIDQRFNVELNEQAISRIETVRDLLSEVSGQSESRRKGERAAPLKHPEQVLNESQLRWLEPQGVGMRMLAGGVYYLNRGLMRGLFRVRVQGLENLPEQGAFVLAPNHVSYLDPFALATVLELERMRKTYWGGWVGVAFNSRLKRAFSRTAHILPIDPRHAASSSLAFGVTALKRNQNLAWFPEGERSANGELLTFKPGLGMVLEQSQAPVVPVYIQGSFAALPPGKFWPRFTPITVIFGEHCDPSELVREGQGEQQYERIVNALHARVAALNPRARDP